MENESEYTVCKSLEWNFNEEENLVIFEIKNIIFDDGVAKLKVPEKEQDLETQVESLTKIVSELRREMQNIKIVNNPKRLKTHKYSTLVENKKKQLSRTQSDSNKLKNLSNINSDKIKIVNINKNALYKNTNTYQQNIPAYVVHKNIDISCLTWVCILINSYSYFNSYTKVELK